MTHALDIAAFCDQLLAPDSFKDYCPNGIQVLGNRSVKSIVSGVTASQALIEKAIEANADLILVHHGIFWRGDDPAVRGPLKSRLKALLDEEITLLAYHLPLDAHQVVGNNVQLAEKLGWQVEGLMENRYPPLGCVGRLPQPLSHEQFAESLKQVLDFEPIVVPGHTNHIERIAWCTGAADRDIVEAAELGVDAYVSGEISEPTAHLAKELGVSYFAAGHHATERYGVQALAEQLTSEFEVSHRFIDLPVPV